jgi:hypothetical protein
MSEQEAPELRRRTPEAWPELLAAAEIVANTSSTEEEKLSLGALFGAIENLDMIEVERNLYYAYGHMICGVAKELNNPISRRVIVSSGTALLVDKLQDKTVAAALDDLPVNKAFELAISRAYVGMDPSTQVLGEALEVCRRNRDFFADIEVRGDKLIEEHIAAYTEDPTDIMRIEVRQAIASATSTVCAQILREHPDGAKGKDGMPSEEAIRVLKSNATEQVMLRCCGLMLKDLIQQEDKYVSLDEEGRPKFTRTLETSVNKEKINTSSSTPPQSYYERKEPIVCPAASIPGTIGLVRDVVVEMIEAASIEVRVSQLEARIVPPLLEFNEG